MPKYGENLVNENIVLIFTLSANCVQLFVYCVQKQRFIGGELFCIRCIVISHFLKVWIGVPVFVYNLQLA